MSNPRSITYLQRTHGEWEAAVEANQALLLEEGGTSGRTIFEIQFDIAFYPSWFGDFCLAVRGVLFGNINDE